jgi:hypothetical protein
MRSLILRTFAAIPIGCLFLLLWEDRTAPTPATPSNSARSRVQRTSPPPAPHLRWDKTSVDSYDVVVEEAHEEAQAQIKQLRREIEELDRKSGGAFSRTLDAVLADPELSRSSTDGDYRLLAGPGLDRLQDYFPEPADLSQEQEQLIFIRLAAILHSSQPGAEIDNYLDHDARFKIRRILFPE